MNQMNQSSPVTQSSQSPQTLLDSEVASSPVSLASFAAPTSPQAGLLSLTEVFVPLESVQPGEHYYLFLLSKYLLIVN